MVVYESHVELHLSINGVFRLSWATGVVRRVMPVCSLSPLPSPLSPLC
jgi:hypothetical protein